MSQPLYITVTLGDDRILRCYKRWSAYTEDAILLALEFSDKWGKTFRKLGVTKENILRCALASWDDCGVNSRDLPLLAKLGFGAPSGIPEESEEATIAVTPGEMDARSCCGEVEISIGPDGKLGFWMDVCLVDDEDDCGLEPPSSPECGEAVDALANGRAITSAQLRALYEDISDEHGIATPAGHTLRPIF